MEDDAYAVKYAAWMKHLQTKYGLQELDSREWFKRLAVRTTGCPKCSAAPDQPCRLPSGRKSDTHSGRCNELRAHPERWYDQYRTWSDKVRAFWLAHDRKEDWAA
jgi:hypothetical protein